MVYVRTSFRAGLNASLIFSYDRPMSVARTKRAARMSPQARREQILDSAVALILARGNSNCTLEEVAQQAGISKPLIYKYFPKREDLLKALLEREYAHLRGRGLDDVPRDVPLDTVRRKTVERSLAYYFERGPIIRLLSGDPAVAQIARSRNRGARAMTTDYFVRRSVEAYGVPEDVARIVSTMVVNAPILSVRALKERGIDAKRAAEIWSEFVSGGWRALAEKFAREPRRTAKRRELTSA
jgi:AcrR family transcriptional regulator